jgi:hypothetical protein
MPDLSAIPEIYFQPLDPYNYVSDNIPLSNIYVREELINDAVDINSDILRDAVGTQGTLANRLAQSINDDGTLQEAAIDEALHNIAAHADGAATISTDEINQLVNLGYVVTNPVSFVRMSLAERDKLALVADEATALSIQINTPSNIVLLNDETLILEDSESITWNFTAPSTLSANMAIPFNLPHQHFYNLTPVPANITSPDYINFQVSSVATPFMSGSLRVFVNGIALSETASVYTPPSTGPNGIWNLTQYTENNTAGTFSMSRTMDPSDIIRISFDVAFD